MIGWCYLAGALLFLASRGNRTVLAGAVGVMTALYIGGRHGALDFLGPVNGFLNVGSLFGSHAAIVTAGMLAGTLFLPGTEESGPRVRVRSLASWARLSLPRGSSSGRSTASARSSGTESYALATAGICALVFLLFYVVLDVYKGRKAAAFLVPAGRNPAPGLSPAGARRERRGAPRRTAVLRPRTDPLAVLRDGGLAGMLNAAVMTGVVLLLTAVLTRAGLVLKL